MSNVIEYYRGDSYSKEITITDESGVPVNISGYTLTMFVDSVKVPVDESTAMFDLDVTVTDGVNGKAIFTPSTTNNDLPQKTYYYRVKMALDTTLRTVVLEKYKII